jgi:hypothetical protein
VAATGKTAHEDLHSERGEAVGAVRQGQSRSAAYLRPGDWVVASIRTDDGALDLGAQRNTIR